MARVDRENCIVLVSELLRNCPDMPHMRRRVMTDLVKEASQKIAAGRARSGLPEVVPAPEEDVGFAGFVKGEG